MQTTDNQRTINILKQILGEYDYLKYDEELSAANQFINGLAVKVTHPDLECSNEVASKIAPAIRSSYWRMLCSGHGS